jgi:YVTN family beta-propeller protein
MGKQPPFSTLSVTAILALMILVPSFVPIANADSVIAKIQLPIGGANGTPAFDPSNGDIYAPGAGAVSVISGTTNTVVATVPVGDSPTTATYDSSNGDVYVANTGSDTVSVISSMTNVLVATITVGDYPETPVFDSLNQDIYVPLINPGNISVISGETNSVIAQIHISSTGSPFEPALDTANGDLYVPVVAASSGYVTVISGATNAIVTTIPVASDPSPPTFDPGNGDLYVVSGNSNTLSVISGATNEGIANLTIGTTSPTGSPFLIPAVDANNNDIYVPDYGSGTVSVVSGVTNTVVATIPVGSGPTSPLFDPNNGYLYVPNLGSGTFSIVSGKTNVVIQTLEGVGETALPAGGGVAQPIFDSLNGNIYLPFGAVYVISEATTTTVTCSTRQVSIGSPTTCTAVVTGSPASGSVTWSSSGPGGLSSELCTLSSGTCSVTYTPHAASAMTITASYEGDATDLASSNTTSIVVDKAPSSTVVQCSSRYLVMGTPSSCTATVTGYFPAGTISWLSNEPGNFSSGSCNLISQGCSITFSPSSLVSPVTITASYSGDSNNTESSGSTSLTILLNSTISATSVFEAYSQNAASANAKYTNVELLLSGGVADVEQGLGGNYLSCFGVNGSPGCKFESEGGMIIWNWSNQSVAEQVPTNYAPFEAQCLVGGFQDGNLNLSGCFIVSVGPVSSGSTTTNSASSTTAIMPTSISSTTSSASSSSSKASSSSLSNSFMLQAAVVTGVILLMRLITYRGGKNRRVKLGLASGNQVGEPQVDSSTFKQPIAQT